MYAIEKLEKQVLYQLKKIAELKAELKYYKNAYKKYIKGYTILVELWDNLPDDIKETTHKKLQKENL